MPTDFVIITARWPEHREALHRVRHLVFVQEQGVPEVLEWDDRDSHCHHALAQSGTGVAIGTGRLLPEGRIGRMAVLPAWRGRGVGRALLQHLMTLAQQQGMDTLTLHAQSQTLDFYRKAGFKTSGGVFLEAGIPHQGMSLHLPIAETSHTI